MEVEVGSFVLSNEWASKAQSQENVKCHPATRARPEKLRASGVAEKVQHCLVTGLYTTDKRAGRYNPATCLFWLSVYLM